MDVRGFAPAYAAMYPSLVRMFNDGGWALAVHGSMDRDFDLVAVPWIENPVRSSDMVDEVCRYYAVHLVGEPETKLHGRVVYTLAVGFGNCFLDLSFMSPETNEFQRGQASGWNRR